MAMTAFAPAIIRSREILAEKSAQVALKLVPDISEGKQANRKFFATFVSGVGILGLSMLLIVNTLLAQDAFELAHLKLQAKMVSDQREAVAREIDKKSSPEAVARAAAALGMKPLEIPVFLNLSQPSVSQKSSSNG